MASFITPEDRAYYEKFIREHPIPDDYDLDPDMDLFDDRRIPEYEDAALALFMQMLLDKDDANQRMNSEDK